MNCEVIGACEGANTASLGVFISILIRACRDPIAFVITLTKPKGLSNNQSIIYSNNPLLCHSCNVKFCWNGSVLNKLFVVPPHFPRRPWWIFHPPHGFHCAKNTKDSFQGWVTLTISGAAKWSPKQELLCFYGTFLNSFSLIVISISVILLDEQNFNDMYAYWRCSDIGTWYPSVQLSPQLNIPLLTWKWNLIWIVRCERKPQFNPWNFFGHSPYDSNTDSSSLHTPNDWKWDSCCPPHYRVKQNLLYNDEQSGLRN